MTALKIVALVNLADDFEFAKVSAHGDERLAHAAFRAGDDDFGHRIQKSGVRIQNAQ